jgi:hypothetical protein
VEYILAVLAFIATIVGIVGKTWKGPHPTLLGWVAGAVALLALTLSVVQQFNKQQAERKIASVAYLNVLRSIHGLVEPFAILLADIDLRRAEPGTGRTELNKKLFDFANAKVEQVDSEELLSVYVPLSRLLEYVSALKSYSLDDQTLVLGRTSPTWRKLFQTAVPALTGLDNTMSTYRSVMETSCILAIERLRSVWLVQRINHLDMGQPQDSLDGFLHLSDTLQDTSTPIYNVFLQASEAAHRACRDKLEANR